MGLRSGAVDMQAKWVGFLRSHALFSDVAPEALQQLLVCAEAQRFSRKAIVWATGDDQDRLFVVRTGVVKVHRTLGSSRDLTLGLYPKGALIGEEALYGSQKRHTGAVAYTETELLVLSAPDARRVVHRAPELAMAIGALAIDRRRRVERRLGVLLFKTANARLASLLLELSEDFGVRDSRGTIVNLKLTHKELAALIGATRETVSFAIVEMRRDGLIHTEGKRVVLLDLERLRRVADS